MKTEEMKEAPLQTPESHRSSSTPRVTDPRDESRATDRNNLSNSAAFRAGTVEFIDSRELAARWNVPASWIRDQVRSRAEDPLPHVNLGKYVRFLWGSPELEDWIARRIVKGNNRRVGRVP
jgi:hypothetical protein